MELNKAELIANDLVYILRPLCVPDRIVVAGSIRRRRPVPRDIDLVCQPVDFMKFSSALMKLGDLRLAGKKIMSLTDYAVMQVDIYIATPETWATLLLIRTGSKEHNKMLCSLAKSKGMHLHASGEGLFKISAEVSCLGAPEERIAGDSEAEIFAALGLPFKYPWERD